MRDPAHQHFTESQEAACRGPRVPSDETRTRLSVPSSGGSLVTDLSPCLFFLLQILLLFEVIEWKMKMNTNGAN